MPAKRRDASSSSSSSSSEEYSESESRSTEEAPSAGNQVATPNHTTKAPKRKAPPVENTPKGRSAAPQPDTPAQPAVEDWERAELSTKEEKMGIKKLISEKFGGKKKDKKNKGKMQGHGNEEELTEKKKKKKPNRMRKMVSVMDGTAQRALVRAQGAFGGPDVQRVGIHFMVVFSLIHFLFVLLACVLSQIDVNGGGCFTYWGYKKECDNTSYTTRPQLFQDSMTKNNLRAASAFSIFSILLSMMLVGACWLLCCRLRRAIRISLRNALNHASGKKKVTGHYSRLDEIPDDVPEMTAKEEGNEGDEKIKVTFAVGIIKWLIVAIMGGGCLCGLICWAIIAGTYSKRPESTRILLGVELPGVPRNTSYGVGFGLQLTSFLLELIVAVLFGIFI